MYVQFRGNLESCLSSCRSIFRQRVFLRVVLDDVMMSILAPSLARELGVCPDLNYIDGWLQDREKTVEI